MLWLPAVALVSGCMLGRQSPLMTTRSTDFDKFKNVIIAIAFNSCAHLQYGQLAPAVRLNRSSLSWAAETEYDRCVSIRQLDAPACSLPDLLHALAIIELKLCMFMLPP